MPGAYPYVNDPSAIIEALMTLVEAHTELGMQAVYWGDQTLVPKVPAMSFEPGVAKYSLDGSGFTTRNEFEIQFYIYYGIVGDNQISRKQCDLYAEQVKNVLNSDHQLAGQLINGFVSELQGGYAKRGQLLFAARGIYSGMNKTQV